MTSAKHRDLTKTYFFLALTKNSPARGNVAEDNIDI